jgi:transposase
MPRPFSADLRERVRHACAAAAHPRAEIAAQYEIGESTLYLWQQQERIEGRTAPKPHAGGRATAFDLDVLRALVTDGNDRTLAELAAAYTARTRQPISPASVRRLLVGARSTRETQGAPRH